MASLKTKEIYCLIYSTCLCISGFALIWGDVYLSFKIIYHFKFIPTNSLFPYILLFLMGLFHLILTCLGVKAAKRTNKCQIFMFIGFTILLLLIEFFIGIWFFRIRERIEFETDQLMTESYDELTNKSGFFKEQWTRLETELHCCGLNGIEDYKNKSYIPYSCCESPKTNVSCPQLFKIGCKKPLVKYARGLLLDGAAIGFLCCIFQIFGLILYIRFYQSLKKEEKERIQSVLAHNTERNTLTLS